MFVLLSMAVAEAAETAPEAVETASPPVWPVLAVLLISVLLAYKPRPQN